MAAITNEIAAIVQEWLNERIAHMKAILQTNGIVDGYNQLPNEIFVPPIKITNTSTNAIIELPDYYEYVDEGVKGIGGGNRTVITTGRFSYKNRNVSRKMVDSLIDWGARKGRQGVTAKNMRSVAFGTAINIKRNGLGQTLFFTEALDFKYIDQLQKDLERATGQSFEVLLSEGI